MPASPDPISLIARLWDQQLRDHTSAYSNMHGGRANSAALLDDLYFRLLELCQPTLFVEAGAYRAEASMRVRAMPISPRVVAFEANPNNFAKYAAERDYGACDIEYLNLAVAETDGTATFHLRTSSDGQPLRAVTGNSSLLPRNDDKTEYERIEVSAVSLDSFFRDTSSGPVAQWIDVEGASGPLLRGARALLQHTALVKIEVEELSMWKGQWLSLDVIEFFLRQGFTPIARDIEYENQFNIIFVENGFARQPEVLAAAEYHGNYMSHHLWQDQPDRAAANPVDDGESAASGVAPQPRKNAAQNLVRALRVGAHTLRSQLGSGERR